MIILKTSRPPSGNFTINRASWQARGLAAWWPLAGNIHEYVRNYPLATKSGNATLGTSSMGRVGVFPGADPDHINTNSDIAQGLSYLTVSAWINTNTLSGGDGNLRYIVSNETASKGWQMRLSTGDDKLYWYVYRSGWQGAVSTHVLAVNQWYLATGVYNSADPNEIKLYIDGRWNALKSCTPGAIAVSATTIGIGATPSISDRPWSGFIRDVRVYDRALSAAEIYRLWNPATRYDLYLLPPLSPRASPPSATTTVQLDWTDVSENEDGFSIERATDAGAFGEIDTVGVGIETYNNVNVPVGHTYHYRVRAISAALGYSEYSNEADVIV